MNLFNFEGINLLDACEIAIQHIRGGWDDKAIKVLVQAINKAKGL